MAYNLGKADQAIRLIIGTALVGSLTFKVYPQYETLFGVLGVYLIMSGYSGTCLIYAFLKLNSSRGKEDNLLPEVFR